MKIWLDSDFFSNVVRRLWFFVIGVCFYFYENKRFLLVFRKYMLDFIGDKFGFLSIIGME